MDGRARLVVCMVTLQTVSGCTIVSGVDDYVYDVPECAPTSVVLTTSALAFSVPDKVNFVQVKAWGAGGNGESDVNIGPCDFADGGGGGYAGGLGGEKGGAGLGGAGFITDSALDGRMLHGEPMGVHAPQKDDVDYDGIAGETEANGRVVMHFVCESPAVGDT